MGARKQAGDEDGDHSGLAVRALTWAVDIGIAKAGGIEPKLVVVVVEVTFTGQLRDAIG